MFRNKLATKFLCTLIFLSTISSCRGLFTESNIIRPAKSLPATTPWDLTALSEPPKIEWADREGPVWSLYYAGEPYKEYRREGEPTLL